MQILPYPGAPGICTVTTESGQPLITDAQAALELIATARYEQDCDKLILPKEAFAEAFFDLRTGLAGEVLQKFTNYGMALAIVGDFSGYESKALRDFIRESNRGRAVCFVPDTKTAAEMLGA